MSVSLRLQTSTAIYDRNHGLAKQAHSQNVIGPIYNITKALPRGGSFPLREIFVHQSFKTNSSSIVLIHKLRGENSLHMINYDIIDSTYFIHS